MAMKGATHLTPRLEIEVFHKLAPVQDIRLEFATASPAVGKSVVCRQVVFGHLEIIERLEAQTKSHGIPLDGLHHYLKVRTKFLSLPQGAAQGLHIHMVAFGIIV